MKRRSWWVERLDELKQRHNISDVALSRRIEISPAMLAHVRAGRRPLPAAAKVHLLDALGYVMTRDLLLRLLPGTMRQAVREVDNAHAERMNANVDPNEGLEMPPEQV